MSAITIEFDPFSFVVALIAVAISAAAYRATRRAPLEARHQEHRDEVRGALRTAINSVAEPLEVLDEGRMPEGIPGGFATARSVVNEVSPRLPEGNQLDQIGQDLGALLHYWGEAKKATKYEASVQGLTDQAYAKVVHLAGQSSDATAKRYNDELAEMRSRLDAAKRTTEKARDRLRKALLRFRIRAKKYVSEVDEQARGPQRKKLWRRRRASL